MKDIQGREVVIGSQVLYAVSGRLVTGVITDVLEDDKVAVQKDNGGTSTVTVTEDKFYLLG